MSNIEHGINALKDVVRCLRETAHYSDEEGESTNALQNLLETLVIPSPNWSKAPDWANWWALHAYGDAFWFENKPYLDEERYWQNIGDGGICKECVYMGNNQSIELLQQRPKEQS